MTLKEPFFISNRLLPALKIGEVTISLDKNGIDRENRDMFEIFLDGPDWEYVCTDMRSGCGGDTIQGAFGSFLSFLSAAAGSTPGSEHSDMFPEYVNEWAREHEDEISMFQLDDEELISNQGIAFTDRQEPTSP